MKIFEYSDYKRFLNQHIRSLPKKGHGEINRISRFIGIHPSLLSQILNQEKDLSLEHAQLCAEYLGLSKPETDYFLDLVQYARAGSAKLRHYFKAKLAEHLENAKQISTHVTHERELSEHELSTFYGNWKYAAIWLFTSINEGKSFEEIVEWIRISRDEASLILNFLVATQLCLLTNGRYQMSTHALHLKKGSPNLLQHHTAWRLKAIEAADRISDEELMYTAPLSLSKEDFAKVRSRLLATLKDVAALVKDSDAEVIGCLNMDFFKIVP